MRANREALMAIIEDMRHARLVRSKEEDVGDHLLHEKPFAADRSVRPMINSAKS